MNNIYDGCSWYLVGSLLKQYKDNGVIKTRGFYVFAGDALEARDRFYRLTRSRGLRTMPVTQVSEEKAERLETRIGKYRGSRGRFLEERLE